MRQLQNWVKVEGFTGLGEDNESIFVNTADGVVKIAYMAYGGFKVVELSGVTSIKEKCTAGSLNDVLNEMGSDWEIVVTAIVNRKEVLVAVDSYSTAICSEPGVIAENVEEYDADNIDEVGDDELLVAFELI